MKPLDNTLKALMSLKGDKNFEEVVVWLKQERIDAAFFSCNTVNEVASRWAQGHSQLLEMLLDIVENAEVKLNKRAESNKPVYKVVV